MRLFLEWSYLAVKMADIADAAGVARHVPGRYFGGKRMLLFRLIEEWERELRVFPSASLRPASPPSDPCLAQVALKDREAVLVEAVRQQIGVILGLRQAS